MWGEEDGVTRFTDYDHGESRDGPLDPQRSQALQNPEGADGRGGDKPDWLDIYWTDKPSTKPASLIELARINREAIERENALKTSSFTKQHFEVVAQVLREQHAPTELSEAFATAFAKYNPNFNRERFLGAATGAV